METALSTLAQVFVGPLVGTISDRYVPEILEKIGIKWDVTEEMEKLSDILLTVQDVLEDAEDKQTTSKPIRNWLRKLKDVAYDVEDILDECATEIAAQKNKCTTEAEDEPESTGIINGAAMVKKIKELIDKFDKITEQRSKFNLMNRNSTTRVVHCRIDPRRETSSFPTELKLYGRDEEKECIVNLMVNNINAGNLSIYAIVGIGGLGKTTLAQMVYHDNMVKSYFEIKRWVCVSEDFEVKSLIGDIIQSESHNSSQTLDQLQRHLQDILRGKRFLLILDDVWNEDPKKWSILKSSLTYGAKGSSIVVTTRSNRVAALMGFSHKCEPKMLTEEDCFSLFKHHAFDEGEGEHYPKLESIGKEIVKKCGGVPLAAKALGGILRFQREENEWLFVRNSELWDLPQDKDDSILPALRLSYRHLPQHLRQCFVYCSIFPKDYRMDKKVLIQQWMAHGFLQPKVNMELEDIGNGIFNDLLWRGFFQEVIFDDFLGNITIASCKMHDLVHDLACSITRDDILIATVCDKELVVGRRNTTRHFANYHIESFSPNVSESLTQSFLRTLLLQLSVHNNVVLPRPLNFSNLIHLRVLDLSRSRGFETLPESIASLKLLRYLDLSETRIALLSDEVFGNLINLQTLKLRGCDNLKMLPGNMRKLINLRHLDISGSTNNLLRMPVGMGQLKCLHMLSNFIVSEDSGCGVGELGELDHLGGSLEIACLWKVKDVRDAENAKLSRKENIRFLRLNWFKSTTAPVPAAESQTNSMNDKLIANALQPHPNIEVLDFHGYVGSGFPSWMNSTGLFSLVELSLEDCSRCKHLPTLGLLPHLKKLALNGIPKVECIGNEFYCDEEEGGNNMMKTRGMVVLFPALEELQLYGMCSLEEWKWWSSSSPLPLPLPLPSPSPLPLPSSSRMKEGEAQVSVFPVLKTLSIHDCPKLRTLPSLPLSIQRLILSECSEKIFERSLENLPCLSHLFIKSFPRWSPDQGMVLLQNLTALQELEITYCPVLFNLPEGTHSLTSLKKLRIAGCDGLKSLNNCLQLLTNLHELTIERCDALELLPGDFQYLVSLQDLRLEALPKLAVVPVVGSSTLETIFFRRCAGLMNLPEWITNQRFLQRLDLDDCNNLESLPEGLQHLTALRSLRITDCHNLRTFPRLEITDCPMLSSLPKGTHSLTSLNDLAIVSCDGLKSLNNYLQLLTNLHELTINHCRELELLPDDFQNLISLQSLNLGVLPKLAAVPVVGSSTLETISFSTCVGLTKLPEWITNQRSLQSLGLINCKNLKSLPEGLQHLTALRSLWITDCHPELHRRCQKNTGEDWHKIAHIDSW